MNRKLNTRSLGRCGKKSYSGTFQKDKKCSNLKIFWIFTISLALVLALVVYLLSSNWLNIKTVEIKGIDSSDKEFQVEGAIYTQQEGRNFIFSQENLVFFNKSELLKNLDDFNFSELKIEKKYLSKKLVITAKEREKSLIFKENGYFYFLDMGGNIISQQVDCESQSESENCLNFNNDYKQENMYPFIINNGKDRIIEAQRKIKLESSYIDFSLKLYNDLRGGGDFDLNRIVLDDDYNTIKARLNNNIDLYFNFEDDYLEQVSRFFTLKRERGAELNAQKYIDLRYGDKIFYY